MLALRRGRVASVERDGPTIELTVEVAGERRPAIGHRELTGPVEPGDEVVVNTAAPDLSLGSGGFDIVHVNLTRGLAGSPEGPAHALKLNYTSLQHPVALLERAADTTAGAPPPATEAAAAPATERALTGIPLRLPVAVLALHGQLDPVAWALAEARPGARVGFVQTAGGALPGSLSRAVGELRRRGLLAGHVAVAPAFGAEHEALTVAGALHGAAGALGWDAALVGPGPGIAGSASALGHGGLVALDSAHAALGLGARPVLVPRMSSGDPRRRHRGLSHHTASVLELLLRPVAIALPREADPIVAARRELLERHERRYAASDLDGYRAAGLTSRTMGRSLDEDELFFRAALAAGRVLAEEIGGV